MAAQITVPQKKDMLSPLLQIGGAVAGGMLGAVGGPAGIAGGAAAGSQLGGSLGGVLSANQGPAPVQASAMERRLGANLPQTAPQVDPMETLQRANVALASQPAEVRQQYEAPIKAALLQARRQQGAMS